MPGYYWQEVFSRRMALHSEMAWATFFRADDSILWTVPLDTPIFTPASSCVRPSMSHSFRVSSSSLKRTIFSSCVIGIPVGLKPLPVNGHPQTLAFLCLGDMTVYPVGFEHLHIVWSAKDSVKFPPLKRGKFRYNKHMISRIFLGLFFCIVCIAAFPGSSSANPEYARATGKKCATCHEKSNPDRGRVANIKFLRGQLAAKGPVYNGRAKQVSANYMFVIAGGWFLALVYAHFFRRRHLRFLS